MRCAECNRLANEEMDAGNAFNKAQDDLANFRGGRGDSRIAQEREELRAAVQSARIRLGKVRADIAHHRLSCLQAHEAPS